MKPSQIKEIKNVDLGTSESNKTFAQTFQIQNKSIWHQNNLSIELTDKKAERLYIKNHFPVVTDDKVMKITELYFEDKIIKLVDTFSEKHPASQAIKTQLIEHIHEEADKQPNSNKPLKIQDEEDHVKYFNVDVGKHRDRRSVVKNIFRLFQRWAEYNTPAEQRLNTSLEELLSLNASAYNNKLIVKLSEQKKLRLFFLHFCQNDAEEYIKRSKIRDKISHKEAIKIYQKVCQEKQSDSSEEHQISKLKIEEDNKLNTIKQQRRQKERSVGFKAENSSSRS